jgi:membrane protein YdbS with pleckstrin-like domain
MYRPKQAYQFWKLGNENKPPSGKEMRMSDTSSASSGGVGVLGLLGIVFVVLKLLGKIDWSWWYVTMPFWVGFAFLIPFCLVAFIMVLIRNQQFRNKRKRAK